MVSGYKLAFLKIGKNLNYFCANSRGFGYKWVILLGIESGMKMKRRKEQNRAKLMTGPFLFPFNSPTVLLQAIKVFCDMIKIARAIFRTNPSK